MPLVNISQTRSARLMTSASLFHSAFDSLPSLSRTMRFCFLPSQSLAFSSFKKERSPSDSLFIPETYTATKRPRQESNLRMIRLRRAAPFQLGYEDVFWKFAEHLRDLYPTR